MRRLCPTRLTSPGSPMLLPYSQLIAPPQELCAKRIFAVTSPPTSRTGSLLPFARPEHDPHFTGDALRTPSK